MQRLDSYHRPTSVLSVSLRQNQEFVRPGFELGYKTEDGKYFIYNHLVFNVLVSLTHGEYAAAMQKFDSLENLETRRKLTRSSGSDGVSQQQEPRSDVIGRKRQSSQRKLSGSDAADDSGKAPFYMIVGFEVSPCSIKREAGKPIDDIVCGVDDDSHFSAQEIVEGAEIVYSYDVFWQDSSIKWASRWDAYLRMPGGKVSHGT